MGYFPICKLKWDLLSASVTACKIDKDTFSAPFGIFYVNQKFEKKFFKKSPIQPPNGVLPICNLPFPNGSYSNRVCRALWAIWIKHYIIYALILVTQKKKISPLIKKYFSCTAFICHFVMKSDTYFTTSTLHLDR